MILGRNVQKGMMEVYRCTFEAYRKLIERATGINPWEPQLVVVWMQPSIGVQSSAGDRICSYK